MIRYAEFRCPYCEQWFSYELWNEETRKMYETEEVGIEYEDRSEYTYCCPGCGREIDGEDIQKRTKGGNED